MAALVCLVAILAIAGVADGAWCVCRSDVADSSLQKALDYACGAGADCTPIIQGGSCYNPNTVRAHCSYAANSYYQRKGQNQQACDFAGAATLTTTDPSASTCSYPSTASGAGTSSSTGTASTGTPPGSVTPGNLTPTTTTTGGGVLGGGGGLGPSGNSISTDSTDDAHFPRAGMASLLGTMLLVVLIDYC
ncbi:PLASMODESMATA CALLOSE-BINDING PROTEIN 2-like [Iris pallida]|uniref:PLASMODESMATA CALLOSE-BINDING PROTEIN 2-like n=1 Tax=Iris pallida TaxID=29817 RepID=A0AAX6H489_IRIPA|nr:PLASMODESMATA CALLOSE-BINDING PROTEIN 2-like [Iris pallida]